MVSIQSVSKSYNTKRGPLLVLDKINLELCKGEITGLVGPSGCGKTTLLYVLGGILKPDSGSIIWHEENMDKKGTIGWVPQEYGLFPWKTVWKNTLMGLEVKRVKRDEREKRAEAILAELGLLSFRDFFPGQLSGGQRQRVSLARVFAIKPDLLLMDEPFSALDALTREELWEIFMNIWGKHRCTALLVTHSIEEALYLGQRIALMGTLPGQIIGVLDNPYFGQPIWEYKRGRAELMAYIRSGLSGGRL